MEFRDLKAQYKVLKQDIDSAVLDVFSSGRFIGGSPVSELEQQLAEYVGVKHCVTCANGTDALQLALMVWGVGEGDAVIVPDFTFFSSGEVVSAVGATPIFVDVLKDTFNIDPTQIVPACELARQQGLEPRVVVAVDLFGLPADYRAIKDICGQQGLFLLEDAAQGFGGSIDGQRVCSFGDISTTSFFPAKPLGCYGDGGAVFTDSDEWAALLRSYAVHGKGSMKYDNVRIGMNSRLDTVQAAILKVKLAAFADHELADVNERAGWYAEALAGSSLKLSVIPGGYTSSWAQYTVICPDDVDRSALQASLKNSGIPTMVYYPKPMHKQLAFESKSLSLPCPMTDCLCERVLSLPMGPYLTRTESEKVAEAVISNLG